MASILKEVEAVGNEQTRVFNEAEQQLSRLRDALLAVRHDATPAALTSLATKAKDSSAASLLGKRHQNYHARLSQLSRSLSEFQALAEGEVTKAIRQHVMPKSPETPEQQADFARYMRKLVAVHLLQTGSFDAFEAFIEEVGLLDGIKDLVPEHYLRTYREAERVKAEGELEEAMEWLKKNRTTGRATAMRREIFDNTQRDLLLQKVYEMIGSGVESAEILELVFGGLFARQRDPRYVRENFEGGDPTVGRVGAEQRKKLQSCLLALAYPTAKREAHLAAAAGLGNDALDRFWTLFFRGTWPVGEGNTKLVDERTPSVEALREEGTSLPPKECPPPKRYRLWTPEPREGYARTGFYSVCTPPSAGLPEDVEEIITTAKAELDDPVSLHCWDDEPVLPSTATSAEYVSPRAPRPTAIQLHDANFVMRILAENARRVARTPDPPRQEEPPAESHNRFASSSRVLSQPSEGDTPGVPNESPLYLLLASGRVAVRQLLEVQSVVQRHEVLGVPCESLPVEFDLPERFTPHSVFTCPVSRKMTTTADDWDRPDFPIILVCGHVVSNSAFRQIVTTAHRRKGTSDGRDINIKCPICPRIMLSSQAIPLRNLG
ncbi:hypothetical protein FOZ61_002504 [Perkinsus olseni]|uniref:Uncharacterized protein n=1 Tax=Perkinsus olseni TaxID=32597 RepID=A0A7J6MER0_PEROL|nr:hypothetical protein FOZ61_002504 [Perkinsus olseni]